MATAVGEHNQTARLGWPPNPVALTAAVLLRQGYRFRAANVTGKLNSNAFSEQICLKFISPANVADEWDPMLQMRHLVSFTDGRILVCGKEVVRGTSKRAVYILHEKPTIPLTVVEAKAVGKGNRQSAPSLVNNPVPQIFVRRDWLLGLSWSVY